MLRLRSKTGEVIELGEDYQFIEITDMDGNVGMVLYQNNHGGVSQIMINTEDAEKYKKWFKVDFCPIIGIEL
jgi:hypothetical protein